jgi:hypothetical protein
VVAGLETTIEDIFTSVAVLVAVVAFDAAFALHRSAWHVAARYSALHCTVRCKLTVHVLHHMCWITTQSSLSVLQNLCRFAEFSRCPQGSRWKARSSVPWPSEGNSQTLEDIYVGDEQREGSEIDKQKVFNEERKQSKQYHRFSVELLNDRNMTFWSWPKQWI